MESARVSWVVRFIRGAAVGAVAALLGFVSLLTPAPLLALHNNPTASEDGNLCSDCHNMSSNPGAVDGQTSYLITSSRALWNIKDANSGNTPDAIGCVYCHFNNSGTTMKGVANHWTATSRHPMGMTFDGSFTTHNDTKNEWLSNFNGDTSLASGELDCVDCHDPLLVDPVANTDHTTHVARATRIASGNLYMLVGGVSAAGQYDNFCRTCHGNSVATYKGFDIRIKSHKDGSDVGANAITEADGTVIKTMEGSTVDGVPQLQTGQCTTCHDEHYSNNAVLFNDGKKDAAIVPSDCTSVCHYAGDHLDNYKDHGHGKLVSTYKVGGIFKDVALACTQCHGNLEVGNPGTRKKHAEKTPAGTTQEIYQKKYNLLNKPQTADTGTVSGNPIWGICQTCHSMSTYKPHQTAEGEMVGCQDCHDEHAEGSGVASNVFMIPEKSRPTGTYTAPDPAHTRTGAESVLYTTTALDPATGNPRASAEFYRADGAGVCDNMECHGATYQAGVRPGPLATLMTGSRHSQGDMAAGALCETCHEHNNTSGGWRASCTDCHGNTVAGNVWPDSTAEHGTAYPNRLGDHQQHVDAIAIARYGAGATIAQKNTTCATCHPNPGAAGHDTDTAPTGISDVHGDTNNTATSFLNIMAATNGVNTDTYDNGTAAFGKDCSNVDCHYRVTTPTTGTATANGDGWYQPLAVATCANCHGDGATGAALPNAHVKHVAAPVSGKAYACTQCHPSSAYTVAHQTGSVNLNFTGAYDPGSSRTETYSVATPTVKFGAAGTYGTCSLFYCHGNFTNGTTANAPSWYTLTTGQCGTCHGGDGTGNLTVVATGNHTDHLTAAFGPLMGAATCTGTLTTGCHTSGALIPSSATTHVDGSVQFDNIAVSPASSLLGTAGVTTPTATETDRCSYCHGSATVNTTVGAALVKVNWATDAYMQPCLTCHVAANGGKQFADGTGMAAPDELGDDTSYGAEVKGHNRPSGNYTDLDAVVTNVAANKTCTDCHSTTVAHINGANDTTFAGQRLLATVNAVATGSTVTGLCYACHGTALGTPALSQVSTHGNTNVAFVAPAKDANAEAFAYKCEACHNAHGMTNGAGYSNIYMIKPTIGVGNSFTTAPGGADVTTIANIRLERVSGTNSMDDGLTTADNVCLTCHTNANRPGSGTAMRTAGGDHTGNAGGYTSNDTTKNCASCHVHNFDNVAVTTTDGFAPQQCNACHSYPGLSTAGAEKILSGVHNVHVNAINDGTAPGYAYPCTACHYLYNHNQAGFVDGGVWNDTNVPIATINVRFDPARNAGTNLTYAGGDADVGTTANATHNGACANLYCHGDNTTSQTDWVGPGAPVWGAADPARLACTACHADVPATGAHTLHANSNGATERTDCNLCHTSVNLIDAATPMVATHADGTTNVLLTWTGAAAPLYVDGYCSANTCHSSAAADGRWNDPVLNCDACHYFNTAGNPSSVNNTTGTTFKQISKVSHDGHFDSNQRTWSCNDCHPNNIGDTAGQASLTIGLSHLTVGAGTEAVILTNKAIAVQDNAAIDTTVVPQWWNAAADWVDAANTCANKCHNPAAGAYLSTAWGTTATSCTFCHAAVSPGPATGSHSQHMTASTLFGQVIACTSCHPDWQTVPNYGHMSGTVNLANMTALTYGGTVAIPYGAPFGTCNTTSCHNNGLAVAAVSPTWGTVSADCTICHAATPATPANGAHVDHMAIPTYVCGDCHAAATVATHINGSVTIKAGMTYSGTLLNGDAGYGTCTTGSCHDVASINVAWNVAPTTCDQCHLSNTTDGLNLGGQNKLTSYIYNPDYMAVGHGPKAGITCASCHTMAVAHDTTTNLAGTNPWRLVDQDGGTAGVQFSCNYTGAGCHVAGLIGPRTGLNIGTSIVGHTSAAMTASGYTPKRTWNFSPDCSNCHDPHGDGTNLSMVTRQMYDKAAFSLPAGPAPAFPTEQLSLVFSDDTTGVSATSYAETTNFSGLCQECHERATASGGVVAWHDGPAGGTGNIAPHTSTADCSGCHKHDSAFKPSGCSGCHGDGVSSNAPDNPAGVYEDRAGAHAKHITAIGNAVPAAAGNNSCTYCHPGNPPAGHSTDSSTGASQAEIIRMSTDGAYVGPPTAGDFWIRDVSSVATAGGNLVYFKTLAGTNDTDAFYNSTAKTCQNVNCHGGSATPNWLTGLLADAVGPVFTPDNTITVADTGTSQDLQISWNVATDALSAPVSYDLYRINNATTGDACVTGVVIAANLGTTAYFDSGLTNGTNYRYCVKAKDGVTPTPNGTNSTSAHAAPTAPVAGTTTYILTKRNTGAIYGATNFNATGACGTVGTAAAANTTPATVPYVWRGGLEAAVFCGAASANNYVSNSSPANGAGTSFENMLAFYTPTTYANTTVVTGATAGTSVWMRGSTGTEDVRVWLAASNPTTGALTPMSAAFNWANIGTVVAAKTGNLSPMSVTVPAGSRLAFLVTWADVDTTTSTNDRIMVDNVTGQISQIAVTEVPTDTVAPAFAANNSGITAADAQTGGAVDLAWTAATDAFPSDPVHYTVYGVQSAAAPAAGTLFIAGNIKQSNILGTATTVTGLAVGNPWWFGVRATDAASNVETANVTISSPGVVPTEGGYGCTLCHGIPPSAAGNAGSHAAHANSDTTYTDCNKCHPGTTSYTSGHSDGVGQLAFDGSAVTAVYNGNTVTYTDNAIVIYRDNNGYGTLTGTAGDGIDNGTCASTTSKCHGAGTPVWGATGSVPCGTCHGTAGRNSVPGDTTNDDDGAPPNDTLGSATGYRVGKHVNHAAISFSRLGNSCSLCHLNAGAGTAAHADGTPSGNGLSADVAFNTTEAGASATYTAGSPPTCSNLDATNCHGSANWDPAATMACATCHSAIAAGAHMKVTKAGIDQPCTHCHPGGTSYPTKHSKNANVNVIEIPTYTAVGITATPGIHLGGDYTATKALGSWGTRPTTEAEMCWFCHDESGNAVLDSTEASEWGINSLSTYDEGSLTTARWIGATWRTAQRATPSFGYKDGLINSVHTANRSDQTGPTSNTGDTLAQIRCSYCHDVHNLNKASGDGVGPSGRPYLRGQWKGSPYKQDGAPQSGQTFLNTAAAGTLWGNVPRGTSNVNQSKGGYWIDQNSGSPASAWTTEQFGGLCALCHAGTSNGNWTSAGTKTTWSATDIGTINVFGTDGAGWVSGLNGHANSVKGGAGAGGSAARNIFNGRGGGTANYDGYQHYQGFSQPGNNGAGFRVSGRGASAQPVMAGCPQKFNSDEWGVDEIGGAVTNNYHQFPCSKCHVPHASRLPRLMKTNCLDTKHNTWDNAYPTATAVLGAFGTNNTGRSPSNWTTAQNCHRLGGVDPLDTRADVAGTGAGWNTVTPW